MKIYCNTSDKYHHALKISSFLLNKFWSKEIEVIVLGYKKPEFKLPDNYTFVSFGTQRTPNFYTDDTFEYFSKISDEYFIYMFEDSFIKRPINNKVFNTLVDCIEPDVFRIDLTHDMSRREFEPHKIINGINIVKNKDNVDYKISTQPSIWNRKKFLEYLKPYRTPWEFELLGSEEAKSDKSLVIGTNRDEILCLDINEGVRIFDIYKFNFAGFDEDTLNEMKTKKII